jgi:transposase
MDALQIGIDVSKDRLDVAATSPEVSPFSVPRDHDGLAALVDRLAPLRAERIALEATGGFETVVAAALAAAGLPVVVVNPAQVRAFARALGQRAKTDRIDAALLARMAAVLDLRSRPVRSEIHQDLRELSVARQALIKDRIAATNREQVAQNSIIRRQLKARLGQIERQIGEIEKAMTTIVQADETLQRRREILASIPGIGSITAMAIIVEMPELGELDGKQAASLAGLAPMTRESGGWKGRSRIQGGRASLRCGLYMPALVALRINPDLRRKYQALKEAGKPSKVAIAAIMRKLIVLANALIRDNRTWSPNAT